VWQITACYAASSYGVARILPALSPQATAAFLRHVLVPAVQRAGWPLARVLTDRGNEFKADFAATCAALGIRQTRIKTRHAWTNGFVERLQQTILTEHWRVVFRRHYFTSRSSLARSLHGFIQFYNFVARTTAIASAAARQPQSSTAPWRRRSNHMLHSGMAQVLTPTRSWTD